MQKKINIELTEYQVEVVMRALDVYSRMFSGQFSDIPRTIKREKQINYKSLQFEHCLKNILFPELETNSYYGIGQVPEESKSAYDIFQVLRYTLTGEKEPLRFGKEKLPEVKFS